MDAQELDPATLRSALTGDPRAYAATLTWAAARLRPFLARLLAGQSGMDVEDIVQESLLAIHAKWHTYDPARPFGPWMYTLARHKLIDALRQRRIHLPLDAADDIAAESPPEPTGLQLAPLLAALPASQRRAIELTKIEDVSVETASARMGKTPGAIRLLVHRGLTTLKGRYRTSGDRS